LHNISCREVRLYTVSQKDYYRVTQQTGPLSFKKYHHT